jgi:hypothetical protein
MLKADNLTTFMCRMSWKSESLNLLEPSGPHRACYGTALLLPLLSQWIIRIPAHWTGRFFPRKTNFRYSQIPSETGLAVNIISCFDRNMLERF